MKRFREVFLYSDEDEIQTESFPGVTSVSGGSLKKATAVGHFTSDVPRSNNKEIEKSDSRESKKSSERNLHRAEAIGGVSHATGSEISDAEWVVDTVGAVNAKQCSAPHETGLMRVQIVEADNGFQDTEVSFQASMEEQRKNNYHYRMWLEQEDFVSKTLGYGSGREIESSITNDASDPSSECLTQGYTHLNSDENQEQEKKENFENLQSIRLMSSSRMKPVIDGATGKVHEVETAGGYCLTVDESEFMDLEAEAEGRRKMSGSEGSSGGEEEESEEDDEELEERRMDALVTVAVAKRLVNCFQDKELFEELEAPLKEVSCSFLDAVLPLFQQREQRLFLLRQAANMEGGKNHKRESSSETYKNTAVPENELFSRSCLVSSENIDSFENRFYDTTPAPSTNHSFLTQKKEVHAHGQEDEKQELNGPTTFSPEISTTLSSSLPPARENERETPQQAENIRATVKHGKGLADSFPIEENNSLIKMHNEFQLLPNCLEDDEIFANAVDPHLRRVLRLYQRLKQPPKVENVVIDGVVMDF